jgi:pilus assembly protein Flp/PilA
MEEIRDQLATAISHWRAALEPYLLARFDVRSERGASLVEYALLVGLIAIVCVGAVSFLGGKEKGKFSSIGSMIQ